MEGTGYKNSGVCVEISGDLYGRLTISATGSKYPKSPPDRYLLQVNDVYIPDSPSLSRGVHAWWPGKRGHYDEKYILFHCISPNVSSVFCAIARIVISWFVFFSVDGISLSTRFDSYRRETIIENTLGDFVENRTSFELSKWMAKVNFMCFLRKGTTCN